MNNKIKVITTFYNPGEFLEKCVASIMSQKYDNFEVIFIDDCSTDDSFSKLPQGDERVTIIRNTVRNTALENLNTAIMEHCEADDIVVILDGDDWFPTRKVLDFINNFYNEHDCWVTYGQASWTDGRRGFASAYPPEEYANIRKAPFRISHLRTWRAGVYHKIKEQDPDYTRLKDKDGNFYRMSYDTAMMFCLLNLTPYEKTKFIDEILYIYNRGNPLSEDKVDQALQWAVHQDVSNKPNLKQISSYK